MLVHHFGSKEKLIGAVMSELHSRLQSIFDTLTKNADEKRAIDLMLMFWQSIIRKENLNYVRLLFEVQILAIQNPRRYRRYLIAASSSWLHLITDALPSGKSRKAMATLSTAVIDGLMLELLSTGDTPRTSQALRLFATRFGHKVSGNTKTQRGREANCRASASDAVIARNVSQKRPTKSRKSDR